jgi:CheY-like chemotaxis protein
MPIMDGPTAASALRMAGFSLPIIGVTGNVLPLDIDFYVTQGANAVVGKPVNVNLLDETLQRLVEEHREEEAKDHKSVFGSSSSYNDHTILAREEV